LAGNYANLEFIATLTEERPQELKFELGKIDRPMLSRYITDLHAPVYYIVDESKWHAAAA